jgi:tellurite resistance protein
MIDHHDALIYTMVLVSASDGEMTDAEIGTIGDVIGHLPIFRNYDREKIAESAAHCAELLADPDGLDKAGALIVSALPEKLRESAYALACEVAASDGDIHQEELQLLGWLRERLSIGRLESAAIERGTRARYMIL